MSDLGKVLIVDKEEMVLDTISMFFPEDEYSLFTTTSLSEALTMIEAEKPFVVIINSEIDDCAGFELIDKVKRVDMEVEIIFMAELDYFKGVLSEFGSEVSDVIYKPVDMDLLEIIINRASDRYKTKRMIETFSSEKEAVSDETSDLKTKIVELSLDLEAVKTENEEFKKQLNAIEEENLKESKESSSQQDALHSKHHELSTTIKTLEEHLDLEKKGNAARMNFILAMVNAIRKSVSKKGVQDLFDLFAETLTKALAVDGVKIGVVDKSKAAELESALVNNKLAVENAQGMEIPFKVANGFYSIRILAKVNLNQYSQLLYLFRELVAYTCLQYLTAESSMRQVVEEQNKAKSIHAVFANLYTYIKEEHAIEKIADSKEDLAQTADSILQLIFDSQDELSKIEGAEKAKANLQKITDEKAQNFDLIVQKLAQIMEMVENLQLGLSGKKMQKVSGDQRLFSKERRKV